MTACGLSEVEVHMHAASTRADSAVGSVGRLPREAVLGQACIWSCSRQQASKTRAGSKP